MPEDLGNRIENAKILVSKIEVIKNEIVLKKDNLEDLLCDLEHLLCDLDDAEELFDKAISNIRWGIDIISTL